jgi:hypothetical protein
LKDRGLVVPALPMTFVEFRAKAVRVVMPEVTVGGK